MSISIDISLPLARLDKMPWRGVFGSFLDLETIHPPYHLYKMTIPYQLR